MLNNVASIYSINDVIKTLSILQKIWNSYGKCILMDTR